ncbi:hypothetical protein EG834_06595, partial [bacterium]|nr:hypothetical protein [bacterium]
MPYSETETTYTSSVLYDTLTNSIPNLASLTNFVDLNVAWSTTSSTISRQFDRDYSFSATKTSYEYNTTDQGDVQYGNLTRTWESSWNGSTWEDYRGQKTVYYPNATNYLTHLPARQVTLACSGSCNFATEAGKQTERLLLYDNSSSFTSPPTTGALTGERTWVEDTRYAQVSYDYDSYGNQDSVTHYTGFGTVSASPTSGTQTTTTIYDEYYHSYPTDVINALNQITHYGYDDNSYSLGLPESITDANGVTTSAKYDTFGRMTKIIAPGDSETSPTLSITYWDNRIPFQVDLVQKVDGTASIRIARFYDGLGQLIQTQTVGAVVNGVAMNVVVNTDFDALGRVTRQAKPYAINHNTSPTFQAQTFNPATVTVYDLLGRPTSVAEPNGSTTIYSYNGLITSVTDPGQNTTATTKDVWGRTVSVNAPTGPDLAYTYDVLDQLTEVQKGSLDTTLTYDHAGQKLTMDDPDMGAWSYTYDGAGNLRTQTDARACVTTLDYDDLNRLESKVFTGPDACDFTPDVAYFYDDYDDFPGYTPVEDHPVGRRTGMDNTSDRTLWEYDARGRTTT